MIQTLSVGSRAIGRDAPMFVAAEIGINHDGNLDTAHRMIDAAAAAGADGVKFQNYRTEDFIFDRSLEYGYSSQGRDVVESQMDMFRRYELPQGSLLELREHCDEAGVVFFSTPTSDEGVAELVDAGAPMLKNGSDFLGHLPLIRAMARTGLPTILSTGMATLDEISDAVRAFGDAGGEALILLHCTSSYPTPTDEVHLSKIPRLRSLFDVPVGFSDHTDGNEAAVASVALGSCFLEKHFTLDRGADGPDHRFSMDPDDLARLVTAVRAVELMMGAPDIGPTPSEAEGRKSFRLSCIATRDLAPGDEVTESDVAFRRPGDGIPPKAASRVIGRRVERPVAAGAAFTWEDFGDGA